MHGGDKNERRKGHGGEHERPFRGLRIGEQGIQRLPKVSMVLRRRKVRPVHCQACNLELSPTSSPETAALLKPSRLCSAASIIPHHTPDRGPQTTPLQLLTTAFCTQDTLSLLP